MKHSTRNSGLSRRRDRIFKPAVLRHFRAAAHRHPRTGQEEGKEPVFDAQKACFEEAMPQR